MKKDSFERFMDHVAIIFAYFCIITGLFGLIAMAIFGLYYVFNCERCW